MKEILTPREAVEFIRDGAALALGGLWLLLRPGCAAGGPEAALYGDRDAAGPYHCNWDQHRGQYP